MTASELLVNCLIDEGVEVISGFSGRPMLSQLQALEGSGIASYQTRHEQGAGFLADGYARVKNRPGVVLIQRGPGVTNCMTPIANAKIDGIPLVVLIGQGEMEMFDKGALQELDHLAFLPYFCKWTFRLPDKNRIPEVVRRAFTIATSGKPGPVAIELPMNIMEELITDPVIMAPAVSRRLFRPAGDLQLVINSVDMLLKAENPVIYAGAGVLRSSAAPELLNLAESLGIPVMTTLPGKSAFPEDHPLSLGSGGFPRATYGTKQAHVFVDNSDCILALGTSFREHATRYFQSQPENIKLIQVDISEMEIGKNYTTDISIQGDIRTVLRQMLEVFDSYENKVEIRKKQEERKLRYVSQIKDLRSEWYSDWERHLQSDSVPIDPYRITTEISKKFNLDKTIILHDAGLVRAYISHHIVSRVPLSFLGYGGFSAMGYSLPASIGARIAAPDKDVICIIGDGSFGMTGLELETAVRYGIKTITLVYNNRGLDAIRRLQDRRQESFVWDDLGGDYAEIASGLGAFARRVEKPGDIGPTLADAIAQDKPALLEIIVDKMVPTPNY